MSLAAPAVLRNVDEEIPILDLAPYLAGQPGALERLAGELRHAFEHIGFYFIKGHGVPQALCDQVLILHRGQKVAFGSLQEIRSLATLHADASLEDVFFAVTENNNVTAALAATL